MPHRRFALVLLSAVAAAAVTIGLATAFAPALEEAGVSAISIVALVAVLALWWWRRRQHDQGR
jgi:MYXO-CTERM domain-containing protein